MDIKLREWREADLEFFLKPTSTRKMRKWVIGWRKNIGEKELC